MSTCKQRSDAVNGISSLNCPVLEVVHMALSHMLLDRTWSHGLTSLKGKLGNVV